MAKKYARTLIEITDIRIEQLQSISEQDAIAEGVETLGLYPGYDMSSNGKFEGLWNYVNGNKTDSWDLNPYVWVYTFKKVKKIFNHLKKLK